MWQFGVMSVWFLLLLLSATVSGQQEPQRLPHLQAEEEQQHQRQQQQPPPQQEQPSQSQRQPQPQDDEADHQHPLQQHQSPSQEDDRQEGQPQQPQHPQEADEQHEQQQQQPQSQARADGEKEHQSSSAAVPTDLPSQDEQQHQPQSQEDKEEKEQMQLKPGGTAVPTDLPSREEQQHQPQSQEDKEEEQEQQPQSQEEDERLGTDWNPLPSDLPSLRWRQTAQLIKCCPAGEALVRRSAGDPPACEPVPADQRWRPLLLNGRSGQLAPPDQRSSLASGNVSCSSEYFWLDSTAGDRFALLTTGHLYLRRSDALLPPLSFCADRLISYPEQRHGAGEPPPPRVGRAARVCAPSLNDSRSLLDEEALMPTCARRACLRKCCPRGLKVRREGQLCVPQTGEFPWRPEALQLDVGTALPSNYHTVAGNALCKTVNGSYGKVFTLEPAYYDDDAFFLQADGRLWVPHQEVTIGLEDFCVDQVEYQHPRTGKLIDYHFAIVCFGDVGAALRVSAATYVYRALLLVSTLFLLATMAVYCAVPELRNLHGRCLISHVAALLTAYGSNLAGQLAPVYSNMAACQATALLMYFSFLAACFWLNAMSFDIWLTFSRLRSAAPNRSQTGRFIKYSVYCWCCPLVLTAVVITMQFVPDDVAPPENFILPRLGERNCWFPGSWEMLAYFHSLILVLMTANIVFFVLTAKNLLQTERDTRMAGRQKKGTERLKVYVNLFIVMGITWIAEALSMHIGPKELWFVTDAFNALQGLFIFLLFTLRQNTRNTIRKHCAGSALFGRCCPAGGLQSGLSSSSRKTGSTSLPSRASSRQRHRKGSGPEQAADSAPGSPVRETSSLCGSGADSGPERRGAGSGPEG